MNYLLVFGSLRKNSSRGYNFNRFGGQTFVRQLKLDGFKMYSLGQYPAVCKGDGAIVCELHKVTPLAYAIICEMEQEAGYDKMIVNIGKIKADIFTMNESILKEYNCPVVESGDWE